MRKKILSELVNFNNSNLTLLSQKLSLFSWDWTEDEPLVYLTEDIITRVLERYLNNDLSALDIEKWANLIECREDIGFENMYIEEVLFQLANPTLYGQLSEEQINILRGILNGK